jgi:predicted DNA-binding protein
MYYDHRFVGREPNSNAVTRKGKQVNVWFSPEDWQKLDYILKIKRVTIASLMRELIEKAYEDYKGII